MLLRIKEGYDGDNGQIGLCDRSQMRATKYIGNITGPILSPTSTTKYHDYLHELMVRCYAAWTIVDKLNFQYISVASGPDRWKSSTSKPLFHPLEMIETIEVATSQLLFLWT